MASSNILNYNKETHSKGASYLDSLINYLTIDSEPESTEQTSELKNNVPINLYIVPENTTQSPKLSTAKEINSEGALYLDPIMGNMEPENDLLTDSQLDTILNDLFFATAPITNNGLDSPPQSPELNTAGQENSIHQNKPNLDDIIEVLSNGQNSTDCDHEDIYLYDLPNTNDLSELPKLTITKQPGNFSFSHPSATQKKKSGPINVTIKMILPNNSNVNYDNISAICMLCEKLDSNVYKPSINFLAKLEDDINCKPKWLEHIGNGIFELKNAHILKAKKNVERETICGKYVEYNKLIQNRDDLNSAVVKKIENMITNKEMDKVNAEPIVHHFLMIEVFEDRNNERIRIPGAAIYSNSFSNYILNLKFVGVTNFGTDGNDEVSLQVSNVIPTDSVVRIFKIGADNRTVKEEQISYNELTISGKKITFRIPPCGILLDDTKSKIEYWLEIISKCGSPCSQPIKFFYIGPNWNIKRQRTPQTYNKNAKRRRGSDSPVQLSLNPFGFDSFSKFMGNSRNSSAFNDDEENMQDLRKILHSTGKKNSEILTDIVQLNDEYIELHKNEDTIFHEVIRRASNNFLPLYKKYSSPNLGKLFCEASNCFGENLLHYACMYDKPEFIRPLIGMGCGICGEEKRGGQTPLHIAIQQKKHKCIEKFRAILKNHRDYPEAVDDIKNLFTIYNFDGYTVMHLAILNKLEELVLDMLKFCKDHDVDVCATKVLCNGDTILHLAASQNLINVMKSIAEYFPTALDDENYEGLSILDIKDGITSESVELSPEMIELIEELEIHSSI